MKHIKLILSVGLIALLTGCAKGGSGPGQAAAEGVSQGNGLTTYASQYKYSISYKAELQLIQKSDREIEINNSTLIAAGENLSSLTLKALDQSDLDGKNFDTLTQLLNHLEEKQPAANWRKVQQPGAQGYFSEVATTDFTNTDFYFFSQEKNVVFGRMVISNNSLNAQHIKSIISTFALDYTSTAVSDIKLKSSSVSAGEYGTILFKATDDVSGLNLEASSIKGIFTRNGTTGPEFQIQGESIEALGDNWYSLKFKVDKYLLTGSYSLVSFCIGDQVENNTYCRTPEQTTTLEPLPAINLVISNPSLEALSQVKINGIRLLSDKIQAGQSSRLFFRATNAQLTSRVTATFASYKTNSQFTIDSAQATALGDDWYSVKLSVNDRVPKGTYTLIALTLRDSHGIKAALWGRAHGHYAFQGENKDYAPTILEMLKVKIK